MSFHYYYGLLNRFFTIPPADGDGGDGGGISGVLLWGGVPLEWGGVELQWL